MSTELSPSSVLSLAKICEYLAVKNTSRDNVFRGGGINSKLAQTIYLERMGIQNRFNLNPSDPTLIGTANYLFSLLINSGEAQTIQNNLAGSLPVITGPANQSGIVGFNASFSVSVAGTGPFQYLWFRNGVALPSQTTNTLSVPNAQLTDNGATFFVQVTNAAGSVISNTATLTVTASIVGFLYYNASDPGPTLQGGSDPFTYQQSYSITHNANISVAIPSGATPNMYLVFKIPSGESAKTIWANGAFNFGNFPDSVFQTPTTFGGFTYYYTRVSATMDSSTPFIMS